MKSGSATFSPITMIARVKCSDSRLVRGGRCSMLAAVSAAAVNPVIASRNSAKPVSVQQIPELRAELMQAISTDAMVAFPIGSTAPSARTSNVELGSASASHSISMRAEGSHCSRAKAQPLGTKATSPARTVVVRPPGRT